MEERERENFCDFFEAKFFEINKFSVNKIKNKLLIIDEIMMMIFDLIFENLKLTTTTNIKIDQISSKTLKIVFFCATRHLSTYLQ